MVPRSLQVWDTPTAQKLEEISVSQWHLQTQRPSSWGKCDTKSQFRKNLWFSIKIQ